MKKIAIFIISIMISMLLLPTITAEVETPCNIHSNTSGRAIFCAVYIELDLDSEMVREIIDNYESAPYGMLTNIDIIVENPNSDSDSDTAIAPFFTTLFAQVTGLGSIEPFLPQESVTIHIPVFWGSTMILPIDGDYFIVDGWVPFVSWD